MALVDGSVSLFNMAKGAKKPAKTPRQQTESVWDDIFLREWREKRGLSQEELSAQSGVSTAQISLIERKLSAGSPDSLKALAEALGITLGTLLDVSPGDDGSPIWVSDEMRPAVEAFIETMSRRRQ